MSLTKREIRYMLEQHAPTIRDYGVRSFVLFGSRGRGAARVESDLDFGVEFEDEVVRRP